MKPAHVRLVPVLVTAVLACGSPVEPLLPPPDFSAVVNELRVGSSTTAPALYVERTDGTAVVYLPDGTRIYQQRAGGALSTVGTDALMPGAQVDVWTTGVELRSLPPQYFARQVVLR
jgi:hypothetical protein